MGFEVQVKKDFNGFTLDVSIVNHGKCMGILGASGCGKSMTLKCIAGIVKPDSGRIVIGDQVFFDSNKNVNMKTQKRNVGYLFQNYALFPTMTVEQNIGIGIKEANPEEKKRRVEEQIDRFELHGLEKRYPSELSGGQQQRTALARMMAYEPRILLLDEPFSALDGHLKDQMKRQMSETLKSYTGEILIVTHSREEIYQFCDQLSIMADGQTLIAGETKKLFEDPKKVAAARLTGCKNISPAKKTGAYQVYAQNWGLLLNTSRKVPEQTKYVGIRAHDLSLSYTEQPKNCLPIQLQGFAEAPFEMQYFLQPLTQKINQVIWLKKAKDNRNREIENPFPGFLLFPEEHLLLLED